MSRFETIHEADQFRADLVVKIAALFPGASITRDGDGVARGVALENEECFSLSYDSHSHRFNISGRWPSSRIPGDKSSVFSPYMINEAAPSISVDAEKTPEQIVKDIARRFLPAYRAVLSKCQAARDSHEAYLNACNFLAVQIGNAVNIPAQANYGNKDAPLKNLVALPTNLGAYGEIECSRDSASFKINNLSSDKAIKLAAFLAKL